MSTRAAPAGPVGVGEAARELLAGFLTENLVARDRAALEWFVELVDETLAHSRLGPAPLMLLRGAWHQRVAPHPDQFGAYYHRVYLPGRVAEICEMVPWRPATLLDIGFGDATVLDALVRHWALPPSAVAGVETTARPQRPAMVGFQEVVLPAERWVVPFADRSFDLVTALNVLHHTRTPSARYVLGEMVRLLADGGRVLIREHDVTEPAHAEFLGVLEALFDRVLAEVPVRSGPVHYRSADEWVSLCAGAGLEVLDVARPPGRARHLQVDILARARPSPAVRAVVGRW